MPTLPAITEDDVSALLALGIDVLGGISKDAYSLVGSAQAMTLRLDLDALLRDLETALPTALMVNADELDPLLDKFVPLLSGDPSVRITAADLAAAVPEMGLTEVATGLTADLTIYLTDGLIVRGDVAGCDERFEVDDGGLAFSLKPEGAEDAYVFDTRDVASLVQILAAMPQVNQVAHEELAKESVSVVISGDTIAKALTDSAETLDALLAKYTPWARLFANDAWLVLPTAAELAAEAAAAMPGSLFEMIALLDSATAPLAVEGFLAELDFTFDMMQGQGSNGASSWTATLRRPDRYVPVSLVLTGQADRMGTTISLSSSKPIFGANVITLHTENVSLGRGMRAAVPFSLTTDTDSFHIIARQDGRRIERISVKLGAFSGQMTMQDDGLLLHITAPDFYLDLTAVEDRFDFAMPGLGLSVIESDDAVAANGYLNDGYDMTTFSFLLDNYAEIMTLSVQAGYDGFHLSYRPNEWQLQAGGDTVTLRQVSTGRYLICAAEEPVLTLLLETAASATGNAYQVRLFQGDSVAGECYTLYLAFFADPIAVPEGGVIVTPEEFLQKLAAIFG